MISWCMYDMPDMGVQQLFWILGKIIVSIRSLLIGLGI